MTPVPHAPDLRERLKSALTESVRLHANTYRGDHVEWQNVIINAVLVSALAPLVDAPVEKPEVWDGWDHDDVCPCKECNTSESDAPLSPAVSALAALPGERERTCATCRWVGIMRPLVGKLKCCNQESPAENRIVPADFYCKFYEPSPAALTDTSATRGESREEFERDRFGETGDRHRKTQPEQLRDDAEAAP